MPETVSPTRRTPREATWGRNRAAVILFAVLAGLCLAVGATAAPPAAAAAGTSRGTMRVRFDSQIDIHGIIDTSGDWHLEYLAELEIAPPSNASGLPQGSTAGVFAKTTGTLTGNDGTTGTVTAGHGDDFDVVGFDAGDAKRAPGIILDLHQPSEDYHVHDPSAEDFDYSDQLWLQTFGVFHHPRNGLVTLPLQRGTGSTLAQGSWTGSTPDGGATETTTVVVTTSCPGGSGAGTVTMSEGDAPALGSEVCAGQKIKLGPKSRVDITLRDGSVIRIGPDSEATIDDAAFNQDGSGPGIGVHLTNGLLWMKTSLGMDASFEIPGVPALAGVRSAVGGGTPHPPKPLRVQSGGGASFVIDRPEHGKPLFHQISGVGFAHLRGRPEVRVRAGFGVLMGKHTLTQTTNLPRQALSLVPPPERPPRITNLKVRASRKRTTAKFRLDAGADLRLNITRSGHRVAGRHAKGRKGANTVAIPGRHTGRHFKLSVTANRSGRVAIAERGFRVSRQASKKP